MTKGTCSECGKVTTKAAMSRHVASCGRGEGGPQSLVLSVCGREAPSGHWLLVEIPADATLRALDGYLRELWLECCGHLSMFKIDHRRFAVDAGLPGAGPDPFGDHDDESMDVGVGVVLGPGEEAHHLYDMGSMTELRVRCLEQRAGHGGGRIRLLARNAPPPIDCSDCGAPATTICTECAWNEPAAMCDDCAAAHPCGDDLYLPVVNSPRSGVCGYTGDGPW